MFNLKTKYRFLTDPKLHQLPLLLGTVFTVQYRKWYSPFWITIGQAKNAEEITALVNMHKKRVTYL